MRFESLKIYGFKSFSSTIEIPIKEGLTGIVGPNGCGKSNILEAVRWCMGESSAKQLRGRELDDIIFAGTEFQPKTNLAEVVLTIDPKEFSNHPLTNTININHSNEIDNLSQVKVAGNNTNLSNNSNPKPNWMEFDKIEVARKVIRGGKSQFYINSTPSLARDVAKLLATFGYGSRTSSFISQGQISELIEKKPEERKYILEEAANTKGLLLSRGETINKLNATQLNVERIDDKLAILIEKKSHLEIQAKAAVEYRRNDKQLEVAKHKLLISQWSRNKKRKENYAKNLNKYLLLSDQLDNDSEKIQNELKDAEEIVNNNNLNKLNLNKDLERYSERLNTLSLKKKGIEDSNTFFETERTKQLKEKLNSLTRKNEIEKRLVELNSQWDAFMDIDSDKQDEILLQAKIHNLKTQLSDLNSKEREITLNINQVQSEIKQANSNKDQLSFAISELQDNQIPNIENEVAGVNSKLSQLLISLASLKQEKISIAGQLDKIKNEIQHDKEFLNKKLQPLHLLTEEFDKLSIEFKEIEFNHINKKELICAEIAKIKEQIGDNNQTQNILSNFVIKEGYEKAVLAALGPDSESKQEDIANIKKEDIITDDKIHVWLKTEAKKEDTKLKLPSIKDYVQAPDIVLNRLSRCYVCDDFLIAASFQRQLACGHNIVTKNGMLFTWDGVIRSLSLSSIGDSQRFYLENRINHQEKVNQELLLEFSLTKEKFDSKMESISKKIEIEKKQINKLKEDLANKETILTKLSRKNNDINFDLQKVDSNLKINNQNLVNKTEKLNNLVNDLDCAKDEKALLDKKGETDLLKTLQIEQQQILDEIDNKNTDYDNLKQKFNNILNEKATKKNDKNNLARLIENNQEEQKVVEAAIRNTDQTIKTFDTQINNLNQQMAQLDQPQGLNDKIINIKKSLDLVSVKDTEISKVKSDLLAKTKEINNRIQENSSDKINAQILSNQAEVRQNEIEEEVRLHYHKSIDEIILEQDLNIKKIESESMIQKQIEKLRLNRDELGEVNLLAQSEYEEISATISQMNHEKNDLVQACKNLRSALTDIDKEAKNKITEAFTQLNSEFGQMFKTIFGGGSAYMKLTDTSDSLSSGLEIYAQPPGKKLKSLSLMSGGEQALIALAILIARLRVSPTPLIILDEVDAPLDDNNLERLLNLLDTMIDSKKISSIIIITHNRITMARMNNLLGVTMPRSGVTELVGVDLEKAVNYSYN